MNIKLAILNRIYNIILLIFTITWLQRYFNHLQPEQLLFNTRYTVISANALNHSFNSPVQQSGVIMIALERYNECRMPSYINNCA